MKKFLKKQTVQRTQMRQVRPISPARSPKLRGYSTQAASNSAGEENGH
jgi:hypothetical protein